MRITDPVEGQELETYKTRGVYEVRGKCLNPPGDDVFAFTNIGGKWWPQPEPFQMTKEREWSVNVHFGSHGPHTIYILKASPLGITLVNHYKKACDKQTERMRMLDGKLKFADKYEEKEFYRNFPGNYQGIDMGALPKGLEFQAKVGIIISRPKQ
jgi:hypothetical protein